MKKIVLTDRSSGALTALLCIALAALALPLFYSDGAGYKYATLIFGVGILVLLATRDLTKLWNWPSVFLLAYAAFSMLTLFWAMSGKFFLQQYYKIFIAVFFYLLIVTHKEIDRRYVRHVMAIIAGMSAIYAFLSIAGASTDRLREPLARFLLVPNGAMHFSGIRLSGIMSNSNIEASLFTIGVIFSIALICGAKKAWQRALWAAALSVTATALLLGFSMGALACFGVAVVVYLIAVGAGRSAVLLRMLEAGVPTLACGFLMFRYFNTEESSRVMVLLLANAAVTVVLELLLAGRLSAFLETRQKLAIGMLIAVIVLIAAYVVAGMQLYGPHTFNGGAFLRGAKPGAGEHTMTVQADGDVSVRIVSKSQEQIMAGTSTEVYSGPAGGARFTVPDDSYACDLYFSAGEDVTLSYAAIDGKSIVLDYKLFPPFVASRIQTGLSTGDSTILRLILARDGLRLFRLSPIYGNGVGSFETGISRVQDFKFDTRYVHNHYVQVMLEDGIIGFALYAAALLSMLVALWKKRRPARDSAFYWAYPALCAQFVMSGLQMLWDVSMSILVFLCQTYVVYALIVNVCAEPIKVKARTTVPAIGMEKAAEDGEKLATEDGGEGQSVPPHSEFPTRVLLMMLPIIFMMTLCGNIYAAKIISREFSSYDEAYSTMEKAAEIDLYEKNDVKLTYVLTSMQDESLDNHISQANIYASDLSKVQSNRIPYYLVAYYFNSMQYELAIDEAMLGATYSASDSEQWNGIVGLLKQGFIDSGKQSPLLVRDNGEELLNKLVEYAAMKDAYNAKTVKPLALNEESKVFFETVALLADCRGDRDAIRAILLSEEQPG